MNKLTPREKEYLARLLMPGIVKMLDNSDFGMKEPADPRQHYVRPHLSLPATLLLDKYYAKLSAQRKKGLDDNAECVIVAKRYNILDTELPYLKQEVKRLRQTQGELLHVPRQRKPIKQITNPTEQTERKK